MKVHNKQSGEKKGRLTREAGCHRKMFRGSTTYFITKGFCVIRVRRVRRRM